MEIQELVNKVEKITNQKLDIIKTPDNRLIEVVDDEMRLCIMICDGMVYTNRYDIYTLYGMTFDEYLDYIKDLNS